MPEFFPIVKLCLKIPLQFGGIDPLFRALFETLPARTLGDRRELHRNGKTS